MHRQRKLISKKEIDRLIAKAEKSIQNEARKRLFNVDAVAVGYSTPRRWSAGSSLRRRC
jgi:hypothetical protein